MIYGVKNKTGGGLALSFAHSGMTLELRQPKTSVQLKSVPHWL